MTQPVAGHANQFFGGIGGEEMAHKGSPGQWGCGASRALQQVLGRGTLLGTLIGGDNYVSEQRARAVAAITGYSRT
jgi:hypothetical protein